MHPNPGFSSCRSNSDQIDHPFVVKTRGQIIKERYQSTIHLIYQSFINKLYHMAYTLFLETLVESCQSSIIPVSDQELEVLINRMKKDPTIFKSRTIYELSRGYKVSPNGTEFSRMRETHLAGTKPSNQ